ncbi:hypothetical protein BGZ89_005114 [Linnemannia elongata]|nr:hypothetical protein BGZ89_005114 [Linnemannia elongata]
MQPYLSSNNRSSIGTGVGIAGSSFSPSSTLANSTSPNQPQLQRDYRPGVVFEYYEGEWDWLPNFDEMRPDHVGIVGNFMIDDTTERDLFRPQVYTGPAGKKSNGFGADGQGLPEYQPRRPYKESGNFAVRFTTHMDITQDGVYSFWLSSNDGSVLYISNTLVVENDGMHYSTEAEGRILLQTGRHPMTVEFFHKNGKMLEGFRSTGPSLVVSYRAPGPVWSFGLKSGPKRIVKSSNLFYDHGDIRMRNLLSEYGTDDDSSMMMERGSGCLSPTESRRSYGGFGQDWRQVNGGHGQSYQQQQQQQQPYQQSQLGRPTRHRVMSGDMGQMQLSTRELQVQMENAKTTIKDLEQIIRDQTEDHQKKMRELYNILQDTQGQVDRLVSGIKRATLFEKPRTTIHPSHHSNPAWRNTVVSIYVDAEEDYPLQEGDTGGKKADDESHLESKPEADEVLVKHLSDVEKLKQLYFFSMALSVKMNREMMGKATSEYTSTSVQKLYEDCAIHSRVPVEGWPGYIASTLTIPIHAPSRSSTTTQVSLINATPLLQPHTTRPSPPVSTTTPKQSPNIINTRTMATMNIDRKIDQARDVAQEAPQIVTSKAQSTLEYVKQMGIVQRYVLPPAGYLKNRYVRAPTSFKIGVIGVGAMSAIPLGCFMGFMGLVTLGCFIVGGIGFTIVEGGFAMFGSVFLLPALGVSLLIACCVGLVSMVAYVGYLMACAVLGMIWGQVDTRGAQRQLREAKQMTDEGGRRITG